MFLERVVLRVHLLLVRAHLLRQVLGHALHVLHGLPRILRALLHILDLRAEGHILNCVLNLDISEHLGNVLECFWCLGGGKG